MPQTKPMKWSNIMMITNLVLIMMMMKMSQMINMKSPPKNKMKPSLLLMKW